MPVKNITVSVDDATHRFVRIRASGCGISDTEDLNDGQDYGAVRAINPVAEPVGV